MTAQLYLGCLPARSGTVFVAALTALVNGLVCLRLSALRPVDLADGDDGSQIAVESVGALLSAAWLWTLGAALVGCVGIYGASRDRLRSLRLFALHGLVDTLVGFLVVASLALVALSPRISSRVGRLVCAEVVRGPGGVPTGAAAAYLDFSRSAEACEEHIGAAFGFVLMAALLSVAFRAHCAFAAWRYYIYSYRRHAFAREMAALGGGGGGATKGAKDAADGGRSEKPALRRLSMSSVHALRTGSGHRRSRSRSSFSSTSSGDSTVCGTPTSLADGVAAAASSPRILLLPNSASPVSSPLCESPGPFTAGHKPRSLSSSSSASRRQTSPPPFAPSRSSSMPVPEGEVLVFAPVRMSVDDARKLGAREAVWR